MTFIVWIINKQRHFSNKSTVEFLKRNKLTHPSCLYEIEANAGKTQLKKRKLIITVFSPPKTSFEQSCQNSSALIIFNTGTVLVPELFFVLTLDYSEVNHLEHMPY